jgi:predicted O-linked N-acetylglucosamine transferase (SPINDLY family)
VSATWLGFVTSTGLPTIDALLVDEITVPPSAQGHYCERLVRLPCIGSLDFSADLQAEISPPPVLERGYVTFASFNNLIKMNELVLDVWCEILRRVPGSRLLLKYRQLADEAVSQRIRDAIAARGVDPQRLHLSAAIPGRREALEYWSQADIALDPFPYNGATTTLETLFMGVPTVALLGDRFSARMTAGYLHALGLQEWVATDFESYINKAVALAAQPQQLHVWRYQLREHLLASYAGNPQRFAHPWLSAVRGLWRQWCLGADPSAPTHADTADASSSVEVG